MIFTIFLICMFFWCIVVPLTIVGVLAYLVTSAMKSNAVDYGEHE